MVVEGELVVAFVGAASVVLYADTVLVVGCFVRVVAASAVDTVDYVAFERLVIVGAVVVSFVVAFESFAFESYAVAEEVVVGTYGLRCCCKVTFL